LKVEKNKKYTGDSSALKESVENEKKLSKKCFFGIVEKYEGEFNDKPLSHKDTFVSIEKHSGIFEMTNFSRNKKNRFWKFGKTNYWLCVYSENQDLEIGDFLSLNLSGNLNCKTGIEI